MRIVKVMTKIEECKPDVIFIEDLAWSMNKSYAKENAGYSFSIQMELFGDGIRYAVISGSSLKKFCCGTAGSPKAPIKKERILKDLLKNFKHDTDSNDEADAIVLAYIGMAAVGDWEPRNEPQRQSLATIHESNAWLKEMSPMRPARKLMRENPSTDNQVESVEEMDATIPASELNGW